MTSEFTGPKKAATILMALGEACPGKISGESMNPYSSHSGKTESGLETLHRMAPGAIAGFLKNDHPQIAAVVMALLDPRTAGRVLTELPENLRVDIIRRLAHLERIPPGVLHELDEALKAHPDSAVETGKPGFEDIVHLNDADLKTVLREMDREDLLTALKAASEDFKEKLFSNIPRRAATILKEDLAFLSPQRITAVQKARGKITDLCLRLDREGKIDLRTSEAHHYV